MTTTKFCTLDQVKAQLNTQSSFTGDDTALVEHIKNATVLIRQTTRRNWQRATFTDYFNTQDISVATGRDNGGIASFTLKEKPLQSITSVKFHTGGDFANTDALDTDKYYADTDRNRLVMYPGVMWSHARSLQVVYVAGYEVDGTDSELLLVSQNLAAACAIQAAFTWRRVLNEATGTSKKTSKAFDKEYRITSSGLVAEAQAMLRGETRLLMGGHA